MLLIRRNNRTKSDMKLLFASDTLKGSLSSREAALLLDKAAKSVFPDAETMLVTMADGGEGTVDAVLDASRGKKETCLVHDPLMGMTEAYYAGIKGDLAVMEMAAASGLTLIDGSLRDAKHTTSYGTGEMILDAVEKGYKYIAIGIGGSATNDGGMGFLRALGAKFYDDGGRELAGRGIDLCSLSAIDLSGLDDRLMDISFTVMSDVTNPLTGENGATMVYGPQKGADEETLKMLEDGMCRYRDILNSLTGIDCDNVPGAGAAGGMGAAMYAVLGAEMRSGIETILDLVGFDKKLEGTDLVVTGEGRADGQSASGKVIQGVGMRAKAAGVPAVALVGTVGDGWEAVLSCGISRIFCIKDEDMSLEYAMENAKDLYYDTALRIFESYKDGSL